MHPICLITIDGVPLSEVAWSRLLSVTVTDKEGTSSDTIDLEFEAGPPYLALPRKKAIIACQMGYRESGVADFGRFTADDRVLDCLPYKIKVQGKSADMRAKLKQHKSRHWDGKKFGDIAKQIAGEHGLAAQIDAEIASYAGKEGYFQQENESDLHWLERFARKLNGLFTIKNGRMIIAKRGAGLTAAGVALGALIVEPSMIIQDTCSTTIGERESHKKVRAPYHDTKTGERKYEEAPANPDGDASYTLRHDHGDKDTAKRAAEARAKELQRSAEQTSVTIEGNVAARGGAPMSYAFVHPEIDGLPWIIETASHSFSKGQGYRTAIQAKAKV